MEILILPLLLAVIFISSCALSYVLRASVPYQLFSIGLSVILFYSAYSITQNVEGEGGHLIKGVLLIVFTCAWFVPAAVVQLGYRVSRRSHLSKADDVDGEIEPKGAPNAGVTIDAAKRAGK